MILKPREDLAIEEIEYLRAGIVKVG